MLRATWKMSAGKVESRIGNLFRLSMLSRICFGGPVRQSLIKWTGRTGAIRRVPWRRGTRRSPERGGLLAMSLSQERGSRKSVIRRRRWMRFEGTMHRCSSVWGPRFAAENTRFELSRRTRPGSAGLFCPVEIKIPVWLAKIGSSVFSRIWPCGGRFQPIRGIRH
jgi:hypothetical protein